MFNFRPALTPCHADTYQKPHQHPGQRAASRAEVLVAATFGVLVLLFLATGMTDNRERASRARCLANLRQLAAAANAYATEDSLNQAIPLHASSLRTTVLTTGWSDQWSWRTAARFAFGGITATLPFPQSTTAIPSNFTSIMLDPNGRWGAASRPLNRYVLGTLDNDGLEKLAVYACPADRGYPDLTPAFANRDISRSAQNIPCIDLLGNSYNFRRSGLVWTTGANSTGQVSVAALGQRLSAIGDTSRVILFGDALFSLMTRIERLASPEAPFDGWHGQSYADNTAFVDGSARFTYTGDTVRHWDIRTLQEMNYTDPNGGYDANWFLQRGRSWRSDCYPTPAVRICMRNNAGTIVTPPLGTFPSTRWPFQNATEVSP